MIHLKYLILFTLFSLSSWADEKYQLFVPVVGGLLTIEADLGENPKFTEVMRLETTYRGSGVALSKDQSKLYLNVRDTERSSFAMATLDLSPDGKVTKTVEIPASISAGSLELSPDGSYLIASNYKSGKVAMFSVQLDSVIEEVLCRDNGRPHAHDIVMHPTEPFVYVPFVKASNEVFQFRIDKGTLLPLDPLMAGASDGAGPRHGEAHPSGKAVYFSNEQDLGVSVYKVKDGHLSLMEVEPSQVPNKQADGYSGSFLEISPDGKFLFLGIRDVTTETVLDRIVTYRINEDLSVTEVDYQPFPQKVPWDARITPDGKHLFVTSTHSKAIVAFSISDDGALKEIASHDLGEKATNFVLRK